MYLGIEIGGTKLQFGVGRGDTDELVQLVRCDVVAADGAEGIQQQVLTAARPLLRRHAIERIGFGFGGPVSDGVVTKSHQIAGWELFPLADWSRDELGVETRVGNDCDVAALAEAHLGAGRGASIVGYVTVGTGVGGGLVINGKSHGSGRPAVAEIGHLRPGPAARDPHQTVEAVCSGWGIVAAARQRMQDGDFPPTDRDDLLSRCHQDPSRLTAQHVAEAAEAGNRLSQSVLAESVTVLGWAIAQLITLTAAEIVVVGGGVSLIGEKLFFEPLRRAVADYVFPPMASAYRVVPAALGELAVVHGALQLARATAVP